MPQVASANGKTVLFALQPPSTIKMVLLYQAASTWTRVDNVTQLSAVGAGGIEGETDFMCVFNTSDGGAGVLGASSSWNSFSLTGASIPYSENVLAIASSEYPGGLWSAFLLQAASVKYYSSDTYPDWAPLATFSDPNAWVVGPIAASNCGLAYVVQGGDIMFYSGDNNVTPHPIRVANLGSTPESLALSPSMDGGIDGGALLAASIQGLIGVYSVPCP
jgi:hypothetical protein